MFCSNSQLLLHMLPSFFFFLFLLVMLIHFSTKICTLFSKREDCQNCSVLYCVLKLCTVISTHRSAVLTVLWIGFCHTGLISLCIDLFVFVCVYFVCFCFILHSCIEHGGMDLMGLKSNP